MTSFVFGRNLDRRFQADRINRALNRFSTLDKKHSRTNLPNYFCNNLPNCFGILWVHVRFQVVLRSEESNNHQKKNLFKFCPNLFCQAHPLIVQKGLINSRGLEDVSIITGSLLLKKGFQKFGNREILFRFFSSHFSKKLCCAALSFIIAQFKPSVWKALNNMMNGVKNCKTSQSHSFSLLAILTYHNLSSFTSFLDLLDLLHQFIFFISISIPNC